MAGWVRGGVWVGHGLPGQAQTAGRVVRRSGCGGRRAGRERRGMAGGERDGMREIGGQIACGGMAQAYGLGRDDLANWHLQSAEVEPYDGMGGLAAMEGKWRRGIEGRRIFNADRVSAGREAGGGDLPNGSPGSSGGGGRR